MIRKEIQNDTNSKLILKIETGTARCAKHRGAPVTGLRVDWVLKFNCSSHGGRDSRSADEMMSREICQPQLQPPNCHLSVLPHLACNELQIYCGGTKLAALRFIFRLRESFSCRIN